MQFLTLASVGLFAALAAAQNAFTYPLSGDTLAAGSTATLTWDATNGTTVSLRLQWGAKTTSSEGVAIASAIDNSGSYDWTVPTAIPVEADYFIYIVDDQETDITNYSARFTITGATGSTSTSSTVASSTSSTSASSATSTSVSATTTSASASSTASSSSASSTTLATSSSSTHAVSSSTAAVATSPTAKSSSAAVSSSTASSTIVPNNGVDAVKAPAMMAGVFGLIAFALL